MPLSPSVLLFLPEWRAALARYTPYLLSPLVTEGRRYFRNNVVVLYLLRLHLYYLEIYPNPSLIVSVP